MTNQNPNHATPNDETISGILKRTQRIAIVGISAKAERPSYKVAQFLQERGYEIIGVNPILKEVLGFPVYATLSDVPGRIDMVDIFRRADAVPPIVSEAIALQVGCIWMQEGIVHEEAAALARNAGIDVVMDLCTKKEWQRFNQA